MQSRAEQHIFVTGACGAGKSTLAKALSHQLQLPLHRLDDDADFRQTEDVKSNETVGIRNL